MAADSLSPRTAGPGVLTSGNLNLFTTSNLNIELNGTALGTQYDQLNAFGTVTIDAGAALNLTLGFTLGSETAPRFSATTRMML